MRCVAAALFALAAQLCRLPLYHSSSIPFVTYLPFVVLAAWYGGLGPGLLCTLMSALEIDYFNLEPHWSFRMVQPDEIVGMIVFLLTALVINVAIAQLRQAHREEKKLRREEQRIRAHLEAIINSSEDAMLTRTPEGSILSWNHAAEAMFGYTAEEVIGRHFSILIPHEELARETDILDRIRGGGTQRNREAIRVSKDGARLRTLVSACHIPDADGTGSIIVGITRDITQLKRAEMVNDTQARELERKSSILSAIIEHSPTAIALVRGSDFVFELANPSYHNFLPGTEMEGKVFAEVWPQASVDVLPLLREVLETGKAMHLGAVGRPLPHPVDGKQEQIWVNVSYIPLWNLREPGSADVLIVANDVCEFKRVEGILRESEERMRLLIEHAPAGLAMFDHQMRYLTCSNRWRDDYGLGSRDLAGVSHYEIFQEISEQWKAVHRRGLAGEVVQAEGDEFVRSDGRVQWVRWEVRPWRNAQDEVGGIVIFSEDISVLVEHQQQMRRMNEQLEERVKLRTMQLENSNRELESFAYSVSHDLRAPLRGIDGWTQAFLEDYGERLDAQAKRYMERVRAEAQRMGQLIDDLLHLSRVSRLPVNRMELDFSALVGLAATRIAEAHREQEIRFEIEPEIKIKGDARLLEIALNNLLDNAVKFSSKRPVSIVQVGLDCAAEKDHGQCTIFVRDNGAGFDMNYAGQLFGAFQRMHPAAEFPGTGIGLATVQRVILKHGGTIRAESAPDKGATFYFTLGGTEDDSPKNSVAG